MPTWLDAMLLAVAVGVGGGPDQLVLQAGRLELALAMHVAPGGECRYDSGQLKVRRAEAWIAAAGPAASLATCLLLFAGSLEVGLGTPAAGLPASVLGVGSGVALLQSGLSALPLRYGSDLGGGESHGRAVWRVLTGAPPGGLAREERRLGRGERATHPAVVATFVATLGLGLFLEPLLVLVLAGGLILARFGDPAQRGRRR